jgi:ABC-type hemin transport system ATPase subunit
MATLQEREVAAITAANAAAVPGDVIVVAALPGAGKTTLLQKLAAESKEDTVYLMFNRKARRVHSGASARRDASPRSRVTTSAPT